MRRWRSRPVARLPAWSTGKSIKIFASLLSIAADRNTRPPLPKVPNVNKFRHLTATFANLPLKQIKEFRFQARPFYWVEFCNVAIQPGQKTDVQVEPAAATISANGTTEPCEFVDISAELAGQIVRIGADPRGKADPSYKDKVIDYGSPVETGTLLAQIDDRLYKARYDQQRARRARAEAELAAVRAKVKGQPPEAAKAAVTAAEAVVAEADAALDEAKINLDRTRILSPFKGFVFARRINVGQNVSPTNGPSLFLIAKDTGKVQVWVSVNEADGGRIHEKMPVHFTVNGLPTDIFRGTVTQIRRNQTMAQNVVTYTVVVEAESTNHTPMPYQKANVQFELGPETPAGGGTAKQSKTENTPTAARTPPETVGGERAAKPDVPWGDWNASWSVRLRAAKATWTSEELPEFTIDLRKREKGEPDSVRQTLDNWLLDVDGRRFRFERLHHVLGAQTSLRAGNDAAGLHHVSFSP